MRPDWERDGIQLYCADCSVLEFVPVFRNMGFASQAAKILYGIVCCVAVVVMNHATFRDRSEVLLPNNNCSQFPCSRVRNFNECPWFPVFVVANRHCTDGNDPVRDASLFEFRFRGQMNAFEVFIPRAMPSGKGIGGTLTEAILIAEHSLADNLWKAVLGVPNSAAFLRTKSSRFCPVWLNSVVASAYFASFSNHAAIIRELNQNFNGRGTSERALSEERSSLFPVAKEIQRELI